uniref:NAD-dependent epimerase/dehydratase, related n=1 Tax=Neospora caninum (strain Liverpool) TaxID=572307 RepID=F0JB07_NEOCL|nr:NAD-dependent epimerase/dehydratase, related [Neospora caninum Liverpool]CEL71273.1 TPA: NAD-dependent epimerase/dehydratase, related [Neospora caninum Liverpool]
MSVSAYRDVPRAEGAAEAADEASADRPVHCDERLASSLREDVFASSQLQTKESSEDRASRTDTAKTGIRSDPSSSTCDSGVELELPDALSQTGARTRSLTLASLDMPTSVDLDCLAPTASPKEATLSSTKAGDDREALPELLMGPCPLSPSATILCGVQSHKDDDLARLIQDTLQPKSLRVLVVGCGGRLGRLVFKSLLRVEQDPGRRWLHVTGIARNATARAALMKEEPQLCRSDIVVCDIRNPASVREVFGLARSSHASTSSGDSISKKQALYRHAWVRYQQIRAHAKRALLATPPGAGRTALAQQYKSRLGEIENRLLSIQPSESFFDAVVICTSSRLAPIRERPSSVSSYSIFSTATTGLGPTLDQADESQSCSSRSKGRCSERRSEGKLLNRITLFRRSNDLEKSKSYQGETSEAVGGDAPGECARREDDPALTRGSQTGKRGRSRSSVARRRSPEKTQRGDKASRLLNDSPSAPAPRPQAGTAPAPRKFMLGWFRGWLPGARAVRAAGGACRNERREPAALDARRSSLSDAGEASRVGEDKRETAVEEAGSCEGQAGSEVGKDLEEELSWKARRSSLDAREVEGSTKSILPVGVAYDYVGGYPREIDWLGQKNIVDAAKESSVMHVVLCSIMGGTDPNHHLNHLGKQRSKIRRGESGGDILLWKRRSERYLVKSGLSYTVVHPGGLSDTPGRLALVVGVNDALKAKPWKTVSRSDVAKVLVHALLDPSYLDQSFDILSVPPESSPTALPDAEAMRLWTLMSRLTDAKYDYHSSGADQLLAAQEHAEKRRASAGQRLADQVHQQTSPRR